MTPEKRQEAERLVEALTVPMAGKYIATDDIKKAGFMIQELIEETPTSTKLLEKYNTIADWLLQWFKVLLIGIVLGASISPLYVYDSIIKDCKVMGVFRLGTYSFACRPNIP